MIIFITILLVLIAIIALLLIVGFFIKKEYSIERVVFIGQPKEKVFEFIKILNNQDHYNKWWMDDLQPKKTLKGIDGAVGFITAWDNGGQQKGEQEIKKITEGQRIDFELRFEKPFKNIADTFMETTAFAEGTKLSWGFSGKNKYPMNAIYKVFNLEKKLGDDMSIGLNRLKNVLENN
ncbi:MAG: SRPBCC family protein [Cytophagaceae bacterium]|nr:SRPBCC family protein [Cytophagaceae bacterium]